MKKRMIGLVLAFVMALSILPPVTVWAAAGPAALTTPAIQPVPHGSGDYVGYYDDVVPCDSSFKIRWKDVDADSYNVAVKLLDGQPDPGDNEPGTMLYDYTTGYQRTYVSLSRSKMESAAGKWIKVFVAAVFPDKTYGCHYYFRVDEIAVGEPPALTNPEIEPESLGGGYLGGIGEELIPWDSSFKIRWEDVDADSYNVAVKLLNGQPDPGDNEPGTMLYDYTTGYTRTYISLSRSKMESAAGKWVKVYVEAVFSENTYGCHYYFRVESKDDAFDVSRTSAYLDWGKEDEASVQISGTDSYTYTVEYDVPADINPSFNYEWLEVEDTGYGLVFTPNRPNYSASARTAEVTVTSGSESRSITVTQDACGEAAPTLELIRNSEIVGDGDSLGTFQNPQPCMEVDIRSTNVRKLTANLYNSGGDFLGSSTSTSKITLDTSGLPGGQYRIEIYASNSDTSNDYWKQSPFAGGVLNLYFRLRDPSQAGSKVFADFKDAAKIVKADFSNDWSTVGEINFVQQYFVGTNCLYVDEKDRAGNVVQEGYWSSNAQATGRCTRAAASMALSYMGFTAFPKYFCTSTGNTTDVDEPYTYYASLLGCETPTDRTPTLAEFNAWYEQYANDTTGKYSPIVLHFNYAKVEKVNGVTRIKYDADGNVVTGPHAFTVIGKDANEENCYYVADSGRNSASSDIKPGLGRIKLVEVDNQLRIAEFIQSNNKADIRYDSQHPMIKMWRYVNLNAAETPTVELELSRSSVNMTWGADNEAVIQVSDVGSFQFNIAYDFPAGIHPDYNVAWLNCVASGNTLTIVPTRANYAGEARTAVITVTAGNQSKTVTITQAACGEAAPTLELYHGDRVCADGDFLGTFQVPGEALLLTVRASNVRKVTAFLFDSDENTLAECTDQELLTFDVSGLGDGSYKIVVYASNSDTPNDYWKQSPFAGGSMTLRLNVQAEHVHVYEATVTDPTCTEEGFTTYTCADCGHSYAADAVPALGHDLGEWIESIAPGCFFGGLEVRECTREGCYYEETRDTPNVPHSYGSVVTEPTCTDRGYTTHTCANCGESYVDSWVEPLGHTPGEAVRENELEDGSHELVIYCQICGGELSREQVEGPSHVPGDITGDGTVNNKDLTRLFRYLSGYAVEVDEAALDINGDGTVNNKDLTRLFRYLSNIDVDIR